jgi:hypothetical protein
VDRIPFKKIATVLAICVGVSLGLCGVGAAAAGAMSNMGRQAANFAIYIFLIPGGILFWASLLALIVLFGLWVVLAIVKAVSER